MTSVTTFACLQMLALRDALPALNCQLHVHRARMGAHFSAGRVLENLGSRDRIGQYYSASRDGHQIHPRRMTRIDSVKINPSLVMMRECIRAPPRRGRYWEIHPRRPISRDPRDFPRAKPEGNLEGRGKSRGRRGWISQYLPSFGGARTISQHQFFYREWIRKSFPVDREGLTVLKSILPC